MFGIGLEIYVLGFAVVGVMTTAYIAWQGAKFVLDALAYLIDAVFLR